MLSVSSSDTTMAPKVPVASVSPCSISGATAHRAASVTRHTETRASVLPQICSGVTRRSWLATCTFRAATPTSHGRIHQDPEHRPWSTRSWHACASTAHRNAATEPTNHWTALFPMVYRSASRTQHKRNDYGRFGCARLGGRAHTFAGTAARSDASSAVGSTASNARERDRGSSGFNVAVAVCAHPTPEEERSFSVVVRRAFASVQPACSGLRQMTNRAGGPDHTTYPVESLARVPSHAA